MVYNRVSWLNAMSTLMKVKLEHEDAPVLRKFSIPEFRALLTPFAEVEIIPERFPVVSRLHGGWKGFVYNQVFVGTFNALPQGDGAPVRVAPDGAVQEVAAASRAARRRHAGRPVPTLTATVAS